MGPTYGLIPTTGVISIEAEKDIIGMIFPFFSEIWCLILIRIF